MQARPTTKDFIAAKDIEGLFKCADENVKLDPICVPSYKFRKNANIVRNNPFSSKVYVFVYEDDWEESGYSSYDGFVGDIEFVKISKEDFAREGLIWRGIGPKRCYIQRYMRKLGIKKYFMVDDDLNPKVSYSYKQRDNKCKSCQMKKASLENAMKVAQMVAEEHPEYKQIGFPSTQLISQFYNFEQDIKDGVVLQVMYFNDMPEDIEFRSKVQFSEDYDFYFTCQDHSVKTGIIPYVTIFFGFDRTSTNNELWPLNDYIEHPGYIDLKVNLNGLLRSTINTVRVKHKHPREIDKKLMEFCKAGDIRAVKAYVPNQKYKRCHKE